MEVCFVDRDISSGEIIGSYDGTPPPVGTAIEIERRMVYARQYRTAWVVKSHGWRYFADRHEMVVYVVIKPEGEDK